MLLKKKRGEPFFLLILSTALVTLFSTCSPIYPINPWDDANVFMTIGKNMLHGMMPYRDLFDLKGILLFIMHEWAAFFFPYSFHGIYIIQILCFFGFMIYSYKIMCLFCKTGITLPFTCLIALLIITSDFYNYGDSVEEFSLPILSYSMYHFLLYVRDRKAPSWNTGIIIGIGVGIILWMKYSILTFYFGALLAILYLAYKRAELRIVNKTVMWIICGILIVTVPVIAYTIYHNILAEFMDVYFYSNIFQYHGIGTREVMSWQEKTFPIAGYAIILTLIYYTKVRRDVKLFVFLSFASAASVLVLVKIPVCNIYYYMILAVYIPLFIRYVRNIKVSSKSMISIIMIGVIATLLNYNLMTLIQGSFSPKIIDVARIVNQSTCGQKDVILYKSKDRGLFLLTDCVPALKHFFSVGVVYIPEEVSTQSAYLASGKSKFVLTMDKLPDVSGYKLIYESQDDQDRVFVADPLSYIWRLGYPKYLLHYFMKEPELEHTYLRLYKKE